MIKIPHPIHWSHHQSGWKAAVEALKSLESSDGIVLITAVEVFLRNRLISRREAEYFHPIQEKWVGFVHNTPHHPEGFNALYGPDYNICLENLRQHQSWIEAAPYCEGLFVMSNYAKNFLESTGINTPIEAVRHPIKQVPEDKHFRPLELDLSELVVSGHWLRDWGAVFKMGERHPVVVLKSNAANYVNIEGFGRVFRPEANVKFLSYVSNQNYDKLFETKVFFLPLFDSSVNNVILECMVRNTPLLTNRHPATEEYLGKNYPLFYDNMEDAHAAISDRNRILAAHEHLKGLDKSMTTYSSFVRSVSEAPFLSTQLKRAKFNLLL